MECNSEMELIFSGESTVDVGIYWCYCGCSYVHYYDEHRTYSDKWYIHTCLVVMD